MWLNATESECIKFQPENCGWHLDNYLKPTDSLGTKHWNILAKKIQDESLHWK